MKGKVLSLLLVLSLALSFISLHASAQGFTLTQKITAFDYSDTTLYVTANVANSSSKTSVTGYAAVYSKDGIVKAATTKDYSVGANKTEIVTYTIENYTFAANDCIKLFLWDNNYAPVAACAHSLVTISDTIEGIITETAVSYPYYYGNEANVSILVTDSDNEDYEEGEIYKFTVSDTDIYNYLGYSVTAIVDKGEDNSVSIRSFAPKASNMAVTIPTDLIAEIDSGHISYWKSETSRVVTEAEIHPYVDINGIRIDTSEQYIVVNGFNLSYDYTEELYDIVFYLDEITLLDNNNDGAYDFIFANAFTDSALETVVDYIEQDENLWYFESIDRNFDFEIDYDDNNTLYHIIKDGKEVDASYITKGDVITILDTNAEIFNIYVSSLSVEGMVEEIDGDVYTINGADYTASPFYYDFAKHLEAGDKATFYINAFGKLAYAVFPEPARAFYYITDTAVDSGDFGGNDYLVKAIDSTGNEQTLTIRSSNVDIYVSEDYRYKGLDADEAYDILTDYNATLAMLSLSESGNITAIYLPGCDEKFQFEDRYEFDKENELAYYNKARCTYGVIDLAEDTIVFEINSVEDTILVSSVGELFIDDESYSLIAYGDLENSPASALVSFNTSVIEEEEEEDGEPEITETEYVYLIDYTTITTSFGETEYYAQLMDGSGSVESYLINSKWVRIYDSDGASEHLTNEEAYRLMSSYTGVAKIGCTEDYNIVAFHLPDCDEFFESFSYEDTEAVYNSTDLTLGTTLIDKNTIVFSIDTTQEDLLDALNAYSAYRTLTNAAAYSFISYGKAGEEADVILIKDFVPAINAEAHVMVVTKVADVVAGGKDSIKITGICSGSKISIILNPDECSATNVSAGNVIVYSTYNNYATNVSVLFTSTLDSIGELMDCDGIITDGFSYDYVTTHFGEITDKRTSSVTINEDTFYFGYDMNVIIVDYTGASTSISAGTAASIQISNAKYRRTAFVKTFADWEDEITDIVVFIEEAE